MKSNVLPTRKFKQGFFECLQRHPVSLRIASPFIGELPSFRNIIGFSQHFLREESIKFQLITAPPTDDESNKYISPKTAEIIINLGVELIIKTNPTLHSKVYQFKFATGDKMSFIGSANFTKGGLERNDETVAVFWDDEMNKKVEEELDRLSGYGADPYTKWLYNKNISRG